MPEKEQVAKIVAAYVKRNTLAADQLPAGMTELALLSCYAGVNCWLRWS